jgi:predicted phosphodiesterase
MKLGIFSDVHGNLDALEAVLDFFAAQNVTEYLCLGDMVGYGAEPEECVRVLRALRCTMIAGNHDYGVNGKTPINSFNPDAREALLWTRRHTTLIIRDFLGTLELVEVVPAHSFRLVHGSPSAPRCWDYVLDWSDVEYEFNFFSERVCLLGHSHVPFAARHEPASARPHLIENREFELLTNGTKYLINVGSVGQPRDGDPRACVTVFDPHSQRFSFHRVEYDVAAAQRKIINAGLPEFLATRLAEGH